MLFVGWLNQLVVLQEAEQRGFTSEDIQVAVNHCGDTNPVEWLRQEEDHHHFEILNKYCFNLMFRNFNFSQRTKKCFNIPRKDYQRNLNHHNLYWSSMKCYFFTTNSEMFDYPWEGQGIFDTVKYQNLTNKFKLLLKFGKDYFFPTSQALPVDDRFLRLSFYAIIKLLF